MKISIIVDNDLNSDIRVLREIRILKESGFEISVLCFNFGRDYDQPVPGISVERITLRKKFKDILFFFMNTFAAYEWLWSSAIKSHIKRNDPDFIHVHDLYMAKAARNGVRGSGRNIPLTLDLHENYPFVVTTYNWTKGFFRRLFARPHAWKKKEYDYLSCADKIVVLSEEYGKSLLEKYPGLKNRPVIAFPNVPDLSLPEYHSGSSAVNPFSNDFPVMLYYGVIAERRGIFETLNVFRQLAEEDKRINLLLIGPVDKKDRSRFHRIISNPILSGRIHYIPWINAKEFPSYLKISDICLAPFQKNPQHESGVANKIFDYMLGGKPVIVSDCKPQRDLIEKYNCGLVFRNEDEYSECIIKLASDESLRISMGIRGQEAIRKDHNINLASGKLVSLYR